MQVWNVLHAARWKYRTQKWCKNRHLCTITQLCRAISLQLRHVSTIGKNLLSSNISPTCLYNMVNFGPLAAEIVSLVWGSGGTPASFNGFASWQFTARHSTSGRQPNCGVEQRAPPAFGRPPSRWALAHISSSFFFSSPSLSGRILDVYHTSTYDVVLVQI